jgi:serine/threonine-protein kinase HipA
MNESNDIFVYSDWDEPNAPTQIGILHKQLVRGKELFSFEYNNNWLSSSDAQQLDPDLKLFSGLHYLEEKKPNFGIFLDSSPDRWGRVLMQRREAIIAKLENRKQKTLLESDYLLDVYDNNRIGGLRFKVEPNGEFVNCDKRFITPPFSSLRELEQASLSLEKDENNSPEEEIKWLNMLIAPGSSLGGARPKASVLDKNGQIWIAKFPSAKDDYDVGAWEYIANQLAQTVGLNSTEVQLQKFHSDKSTFLTKRFDRKASGGRIHFASAMTLLGYNDGDNYTDGISYLELAEFIITNGANPKEDLIELWKRIVFFIFISNTDDHLRNHGFILTNKGWALSPVYDINPNPFGSGLRLNINETDNSLSIDLALGVAEYFRLNKLEAEKIISDIKQKLTHWETIALMAKVSKSEIALMENAFCKNV